MIFKWLTLQELYYNGIFFMVFYIYMLLVFKNCKTVTTGNGILLLFLSWLLGSPIQTVTCKVRKGVVD